MTNKLPVVGNRYRATDSNKLITNKDYILTCDEILSTTVILNKEKNGSYISWPINGFFEDFKELPETKLPVVGKRYRRIGEGYEIVVGEMEQHLVYFRMADENNKESFSCPLEIFWEDFEELPEDKAETKPETQSPELSPEVKKAMEELDKELDRWMPTEDKEEYQLTSKAEKLLNALDKQFMSKEEVKIDTSSGSCLSDTKESIWKPVSELPTPRDRRLDNIDLLLRLDTGKVIYAQGYKNDIEPIQNTSYEKYSAYQGHYCELTDFVNDHEKLKERVRKLEEKCGKS